MSAMTANYTINQGETWSQAVTLDPVVNLTGYTGKCQIREYPSPAYPVVASPTVTLSLTPTDGKFTLSLSADDTANIPCGTPSSFTDKKTYYYDVDMIDSPTVLRVLQGTIQVVPAVTR